MASANALQGLMKWLSRDEWREPFDDLIERHLGPACERAGIARDQVADAIGGEHAGVLWGCLFEDFLTCDLDDDSNIVDDYLKRRSWKESVPNKRYMMALRASVMSLYEVSDVVRNESFLARDLLRGGEAVRVSEKSATHSLKQWDRIAARIVRVGPKFEMAGGVLAFTHELGDVVSEGFAVLKKEMLSDLRKSARHDDADVDPIVFDTEVLRHSAFLFTNVWLDDALQRALDPKPPKLCNSDGDEIAFTTVRYPLKQPCDREALECALTAIPEFHRARDDLWNWIPITPPATGKPPEGAQIVLSTFNGDSVSMGSVDLDAKSLKLEVNSPQRAQRGRTLLEPVIGPFVGEPIVESKSAAELMASPSADEGRTPSSRLPPDEERAIIQEALERHYRGLLDKPVPMLGNVSPRKAARTKKGREKLVGWLKLIENSNVRQEADSPIASYDMSWMWDELGITDFRR
ncbi:MAG: hypothetical protein HYX37_17150 [Rhizobiales bacterium]|nr:hypothetical protein [Hyphomicrobiales bacterium]